MKQLVLLENGVLLRHLLGCLPGRLFPIAGSAYGDGWELASPGEGEEPEAGVVGGGRSQRVKEGHGSQQGWLLPASQGGKACTES